VDAVVLGDRVLRLRRGDLRDRLLEILAGHGGVESAQRVEQTRTDQQVIPRIALACSRVRLARRGEGASRAARRAFRGRRSPSRPRTVLSWFAVLLDALAERVFTRHLHHTSVAIQRSRPRAPTCRRIAPSRAPPPVEARLSLRVTTPACRMTVATVTTGLRKINRSPS
jgi:hypothetical protein